VGFIACATGATGAQAEAAVRAMVLALTHRPGAADAGFWTVATASGDWCVSGTQMTSAAGRTDLARRTDCADRAGALAVCDGSLTDGFALAVFKDGERPFLARDPLGLKPLYQLEHRGRVTAFASELKAFGEASGLLPGEVRVFPPGHAWTPAGIRPFSLIRNWPHWPRGPAAARDIETAARDVRRMLERAVERLCGEGAAPVPAATAPVAVFLSGGIDSSAVAAAAVVFPTPPFPVYSRIRTVCTLIQWIPPSRIIPPDSEADCLLTSESILVTLPTVGSSLDPVVSVVRWCCGPWIRRSFLPSSKAPCGCQRLA